MPGIEDIIEGITGEISSISKLLNNLCAQPFILYRNFRNCLFGWVNFFSAALGIGTAGEACSLLPYGMCGMSCDVCTFPYGFPLGWCYDWMKIPMDLYAGGVYGGCIDVCDIPSLALGFCADICNIPWEIFTTCLDGCAALGGVVDSVCGIPLCGILISVAWFVGCFACGGCGSFMLGILSQCCGLPHLLLDVGMSCVNICPLLFDQCHICCDLPGKVVKQILGHDISYMVCQVFTDMIIACSESPYICLRGVSNLCPFVFTIEYIE
jgi:hypothetical protein